MSQLSPSKPIDALDGIAAWIAHDHWRVSLLRAVSALNLPDAWIGAGFVRNLVWDALHGYSIPTPLADVDVVYFDLLKTERSVDLEIEARLLQQHPNVRWQVRNQARMHEKNGDAPYSSSADAISKWPETATAIAARLNAQGAVEILSPLGIDDLVGLIVRPTSHYASSASKKTIYHARVREKNWEQTWPRLTFEF